MIRLLRTRAEGRRTRAADRLLDRLVRAGDNRVVSETALDEEATLEMERLWALTGAVIGDPRIRSAIDEDIARFQPVPLLRRMAPIAAALVLALTGITALVWFGIERTAQIAPAPIPNIATEIGQRKRVVLADTSSVALDTDSEVAVAMDRSARRVTLRRGRAFFRVAKDGSRPFIVSAGDKRVRAVGTAFEVRIEQGSVLVTVVEGTVEVTERYPQHAVAQSARIGPGTQLATLAHSAWTMRRIDSAQSTIWLTGRLSFVDESIATAVSEMNRYSRQKITFRDGAAPDERILGVFRAGDTLALAQAMELNGFAHILEVTPERITIDAKK